ncbi:hypothetical protein O181_031589 [Austropuccinia psidii MF-1]|uniref:Helitron helicase-like domain-containing protein n=1 Tax=Austropuccinia psidii MF-1 TaxID=1389203 RepID=A0A9Q3H6P8_9BASI|nr:hypothetical protein [Austropuccinia psidii MF-1]
MVNEGAAAINVGGNNERNIKDKYFWEIPLDIGECSDRCKSCGAFHWKRERIVADFHKESASYSICCQAGTVSLPLDKLKFGDLHPFLNDMFFSKNRDAKSFREHSRMYNNALTFTSAGVCVDATVQGRGTYCYRVSGELHHIIGSVFPLDGEVAKFAQIFLVGDNTENEAEIRRNNAWNQLSNQILLSWQRFLTSFNPYAKAYRSAGSILKANVRKTLALKTFEGGRLNHNTYNAPSISEVAAIVQMGEGNFATRDIQLQRVGGTKLRIHEIHSGYLALRYPILFPYGEQHWHPNYHMEKSNRMYYSDWKLLDLFQYIIIYNTNFHVGRRTAISQLEWYAYLLFNRNDVVSLPLRGKRLFQEFIVDLYLCIEQSRLRFIRSGPRAMVQLFQDAMALVTTYRKPSLFITMTANSKWNEVQQCLKPGEIASDRPDIIARVFNIKLKMIIRDLTKNKRLGSVKSYVYTVEFQKRGLPHAHIIIILNEPFIPKTIDGIDTLVCAEIPDPDLEPDLHRIVTATMFHGPCSPSSRCWGRFGCKYGYPKAYVEETTIRNDAYPAYRRRAGTSFARNGKIFTNRDVVPYNKYLSLQYECHINTEIPYGIKALKYLYKYICKGEDRAAMNMEINDETKAFVDGRYIGPSEGMNIHSIKLKDF